MPHIDRFSVSLDMELLAAFDGYIREHGYENRSEAVRDLIRDLLVNTGPALGDKSVSAILVIVCDHGEGEAAKRLRACLAAHSYLVTGSLHMSIDDRRDHVAVGLRGPADRIQTLADQVQAMRGVALGRLSIVPAKE